MSRALVVLLAASFLAGILACDQSTVMPAVPVPPPPVPAPPPPPPPQPGRVNVEWNGGLADDGAVVFEIRGSSFAKASNMVTDGDQLLHREIIDTVTVRFVVAGNLGSVLLQTDVPDVPKALSSIGVIIAVADRGGNLRHTLENYRVLIRRR